MFGWHLIIEYGLYIGLKFFLSITEQITNLTKNLKKNKNLLLCVENAIL